jgi:hypothetical protein
LSKVSEKLASMSLTVWTIVIMLLWLVWGMFMAGSSAYTKGFHGMNNVLVKDWFLSNQTDYTTLKLWFAGLCILMVVLCVNLIFCSWEKIFRIMQAKFSGPKFLMLIVHAVFGFVALGHFGGLVLGYKHSNIQLGEGQKYNFEDGYDLTINKVVYIGDHKTLKKPAKYISKDDFDYTKNFVEIILRKDGRDIRKDSIYILTPMRYKDIQVTLRGFIEPSESDGIKENAGATPRITVNISRNPVLKAYLIIYPIMIAGIFIYLILTWKSSSNDTWKMKTQKPEII